MTDVQKRKLLRWTFEHKQATAEDMVAAPKERTAKEIAEEKRLLFAKWLYETGRIA